MIVARGDHVECEDLPPPLSSAPDSPRYEADTLNLDEVERRTIMLALESTDWNKVHAAGELGIYPSSLYKKLKRFGIPLQPPE